MKHDPVRVLAISGSLRARSANTAVLEAARQLAPPGMEVVLYRGIADLPAFNPDHEHPDLALPPAAAELRARVAGAEALLISSPEYAHGIPGALKNLLDWLVGSVDFPGKPVALISVFERSLFVQPQLAEVLRTMSARLVPAEAVIVPIARRDMNAPAIAAHPGHAAQLQRALTGLLRSLASP
jgi:NAD(P)H-dependent FMN reductase